MHLDVTTARQAQDRRQESESRFRQMAESINDVFFLQSADASQLLYVSPAYEQIWGETCESLYADPASWEASIHPDDRAHAVAATQGDSASPSDREFRIVRPDGAVRWIQMRAFPILDGAGGAYRTAGIWADVTKRKLAERDRRESDRRFSDLLRNVDLLSVMLDRQGRITYCNDYALRLTGWRREDVIGQDWFAMFVPAGIDQMKSAFQALLADAPEVWHYENEIRTRSGERRLVRWNNSVLRSGAGDVIGTASIGEDITQRKEAEERIAHLNRVYAMLSGINTLIVRVREREQLFREACRIAVECGGFRMSWIGLVDRTAMLMVPAASAGAGEEFLDALRDRFALGESAPLGQSITAQAIREKRAIVSNDSEHDPRALMGKMHAASGIRSLAVLPLVVADEAVGVLALYAGETEFFQAEEMSLLTELADDIAFAIDSMDKQARLDYLSYYDVLTGLANRSLFVERLAQFMRSASAGAHQLALAMFDLERFKNINDSLGQPAGDALLRQVAAWLTQHMGDASLLARVGADHFAVVLPRLTQPGNVGRLLEHMLEAFLRHPFQLNESVFHVAGKLGVAIFPDDGADAGTLFKHAEAALKRAKATGERYLFYTQSMTATVARKLTLENQLRNALENDEYVLHYQPKIALADGKLTGAEALIRWNDPRTGLVAPGQFVPILEETGLIREVGRWALRKCIADYLRWLDAGLPAVRIAVNVSPLQMQHRGFRIDVEQVIALDARAAQGLELELTENMVMGDLAASIDTLERFRALGLRIAIDDFGTGFSSLSSLSRLPVDTLKIDRAFILDMTSGPRGLALVSTIITLAHSLRLNVVAEGVETTEQAQLLRGLHCDEMQGFLFSRAVPPETFEARFLKGAGPHGERANPSREGAAG
jgi:diguanylate cyclase (GGDEF)-like protein/PAS domain S-box-containing protein